MGAGNEREFIDHLQAKERGGLTMKCPKCGAVMTQGAPHVLYPCRQWECRHCGKIIIETLQ